MQGRKGLKERLTAWSLRAAECEHQLKVMDEAQRMFAVREMMPKDMKREFLTGPRKFDEIMQTLGIFINETMADDRPVPLDLGNVGTHPCADDTERFGHEQRHVI